MCARGRLVRRGVLPSATAADEEGSSRDKQPDPAHGGTIRPDHKAAAISARPLDAGPVPRRVLSVAEQGDLLDPREVDRLVPLTIEQGQPALADRFGDRPLELLPDWLGPGTSAEVCDSGSLTVPGRGNTRPQRLAVSCDHGDDGMPSSDPQSRLG